MIDGLKLIVHSESGFTCIDVNVDHPEEFPCPADCTGPDETAATETVQS